MSLAKDRDSEMVLINKRIARAMELKRNIYDTDVKIREKYERGEISYWDYQQLLNKELGGKSKEYWLNYYDNYIADLNDRLPERKLSNKWLILGIFLVMSLGILMFNNYTGFTIIDIGEESILRNIMFNTLDESIYVPEILLDENAESIHPINLATFNAYRYLIIKNKIDLSGIKGIELDFVVEKDWIEDNGFDAEDIVLYEFPNGKWSQSFIELVDEDSEYYYYKGKVTSMKEFAIGASAEKPARIIRLKPTVKREMNLLLLLKENKDTILYGLVPLAVIIMSALLFLWFILRRIRIHVKKTKASRNLRREYEKV